MSSTYGKNIQISIFGQSHSEAIGVVVDGIPAGERFDLAAVRRFMKRRAPGGKAYSTARSEADLPLIQSGLLPLSEEALPDAGAKSEEEIYISCGAPICALIKNSDTRSKDYSGLSDVPRPSHADYPAAVKYRGAHDIRGGGHFSGRLTAPLCFAGALCLALLKRRGIQIGAHIAAIGGEQDEAYDPVGLTPHTLGLAALGAFPVVDAASGARMQALIEAARMDADSVGGVIECGILGLPCGIGEPMFGGLENRIAQAVFGIPAVKGIEFGDGFSAAALRGSENNDAYEMQNGRVAAKTNHAGGILGGISTGMPVIFRTAIKPTPSIARAQQSVSLSQLKNEQLIIHGRHDPCIVPRAVPCVEAAAALAVCDLYFDALHEGFLKENDNKYRWENQHGFTECKK